MRSWTAGAALLLLAGCGISRQVTGEATGEETADASAVTLSGALAECRRLYPDQVAQAVARSGCVIKATDIIRSQLPFPELLDRENSYRKSVAEQLQAGKISLIERNREMHKLHASLVAEEAARLQSTAGTDQKPSPEATQWRSSNPETCSRFGGSAANCF